MDLEDWRPAAASRSPPHHAGPVNDDLIDVLAAVMAIVVMTVIAFAF